MSGGKIAVRITRWRESKRGSEKAVVNGYCAHRRESVGANVDRAVSAVTLFGAAQIWEAQDESPGWNGFKDEAC